MTEQKRLAAESERYKGIQQELTISKNRLDHILNTSPAVIYVAKLSDDYGATYISDNISKQLGYEPSDFTRDASFWANHIHPNDMPKVFDESGAFAGHQSLIDKGVYLHEYRFQHKDGTYRWMRDEMNLVCDQDGKPLEIIGYWIDITDRKLAEEEIRKLLQENRKLTHCLVNIHEQERRYIAREFHDEFGQWLTATQLHASVISNYTKKQAPELHDSVMAIETSARKMLNLLRNMTRGLRPGPLYDSNLATALAELVDQWQLEHPECKCELSLYGIPDDLDENLSLIIYRITQESMTNVARHAEASRVAIEVCREQGSDILELRIEDNGKGFDPSNSSEGVGLIGMRERVLTAEGEFLLKSQPGTGVYIEARLPIEQTLKAHIDE